MKSGESGESAKSGPTPSCTYVVLIWWQSLTSQRNSDDKMSALNKLDNALQVVNEPVGVWDKVLGTNERPGISFSLSMATDEVLATKHQHKQREGENKSFLTFTLL